jgi:hypothetical protein
MMMDRVNEWFERGETLSVGLCRLSQKTLAYFLQFLPPLRC